MRIVMDSWEGYNFHTMEKDPAPPMTCAGVKHLFGNVEAPANLLDARFQKKNWDVSNDPLPKTITQFKYLLLEAFGRLSHSQKRQNVSIPTCHF